jgi:RNA polymerase sigma-70 factor (ECF subfamily)
MQSTRRAWYASVMAGRNEGDGAAPFGQQALAHADKLFNLARYLTASVTDAEDLLQETYVRAFAAAAGFDGQNLKAWLFKILRNTFVDQYRKEQQHPTRGGLDTVHADTEGLVDADRLREEVEVDQLRKIVSRELEAALLTLSEDARTVILLDLEGMTEVEIADVLGCAIGTVKSRLSRARTVLRQRLKDYAR